MLVFVCRYVILFIYQRVRRTQRILNIGVNFSSLLVQFTYPMSRCLLNSKPTSSRFLISSRNGAFKFFSESFWALFSTQCNLHVQVAHRGMTCAWSLHFVSPALLAPFLSFLSEVTHSLSLFFPLFSLNQLSPYNHFAYTFMATSPVSQLFN